jgi:hypothetical protein
MSTATDVGLHCLFCRIDIAGGAHSRAFLHHHACMHSWHDCFLHSLTFCALGCCMLSVLAQGQGRAIAPRHTSGPWFGLHQLPSPSKLAGFARGTHTTFGAAYDRNTCGATVPLRCPPHVKRPG